MYGTYDAQLPGEAGPAGGSGLDRYPLDDFVREVARGLRREEFTLLYQPVVDLGSGRLEGFEALVRWSHPRFGLLGPDRFVPRLEGAGAIRGLGARVLEDACTEAAGWPVGAGSAAVVRVNVSARQLDDDALSAQVPAVLARTGLEPDRLALEITETAALRDVAVARRVCGRLRDLGVRIVLDDYGAGSSDLVRLRQLPVDEIKVDRHLTAGAQLDPRCLNRVVGIVDLGRVLGLRVTVEGVETASQLRIARGLGDVCVQGYWFGRPLRIEGAGGFRVVQRRVRRALREPRPAADRVAVAG